MWNSPVCVVSSDDALGFFLRRGPPLDDLLPMIQVQETLSRLTFIIMQLRVILTCYAAQETPQP